MIGRGEVQAMIDGAIRRVETLVRQLQSRPAADESNLKMIRGIVNSDASIAEGTGFTITDNGAGDHTINFTDAFSDVPTVVVAVSTGSSDRYAGVESAAAGSARVITWNNASTPTDARWHFVAIGPA